MSTITTKSLHGQEMWVTAEDIRQYAYCPRKIYYRYVLRQKVQTTPKIERGKEIHRETCKNKKPERMGSIERYYNVYLRDENLRISGSADIIEWDGETGVLIDLKTGRTKETGIWYPDKIQLIALAMLAEEQLHIRIDKIGIWDYRKDSVTFEEIDDKYRLKVLEIIGKIRKIVAMEVFPKVKKGKRCFACECYKLCWGL